MVEHARAVIIGGGVGGTSIAYHLTELGWKDVVLVDRAELTSGSTFHSAGLVGQLRSSVTLTKMMMYGSDLYRRLAAETGTDPSWHEVGSLRLASSPERFEELRRQAGWAKTFGLPLELITAQEAQDRFPLMTTDGVLGAVWLPTDGWLDPSGLANALAAGARRRGAQIRTQTRVVAIGADRGRVTGVTVEHKGERSEIRADVVVNAGGMFAPEIGRMVGVTVPIIPMAHQYLFTEPIDGVHPGLPQLRDPDNLVYFREEVGGLCMGGYERDPAPWSLDGIPPDFNGKLLAPDTARFEPIMEGAIRRVPAMADAGVNRVINGPEGFTPDNEFILGESRRARLLRGRRVLRARHRGGGRDRAPDGDLDRRRRTRARPLEDGHPAVRAGLPEPGVHARPVDRDLRDLLRHPLPERGAPRRPPAADLADLRRARGSRSGLRREVGLGAPELVRDQRRRQATRRSDRAAGPASTGRQPSAPRRWRRARPPACSTRPRSPRSRSSVRAPSPSCRRCAPTTSTCRSGGSSTRSCSTGAAGSSAT